MGHYPKYIETKWLVFIDEDEQETQEEKDNSKIFESYFWHPRDDDYIELEYQEWKIWEAYDCCYNRWIWHITWLWDAEVPWKEFFPISKEEQEKISKDIKEVTWIDVFPKHIVRFRYTYWG